MSIKQSNKDVINLMNEFLTPIRIEKRASEEIAEVKSDSGKPLTKETKKDDGKNQGAAGSEKTQDVDKAIKGNAAQSDAATVKPGDGTTYADTAGTKKMDASKTVSQDTVKVKKADDPSQDIKLQEGKGSPTSEKQAFARNARLARKIEQLIAVNDQQKEASEKEAAKQAWIRQFQYGMEKRAEDHSELRKAGFTDEQAEMILDKIAAEDPEAVLPPETIDPAAAENIIAGGDGAPAAAEATPEGAPSEEQLQQLADMMSAHGVTPEQLQAADAKAKELQEQGFTPEEIIQAAIELEQEASAPEQAEMAAKEAALKAQRVGVLKNMLRANA